VARYTTAEIKSLLAQVEIEAKMQGLLEWDYKLEYSKGGSAIAPVLYAEDRNGHVRRSTYGSSFLPEFGYADGPKQVARSLECTLRVLYALRVQRERIEANSTDVVLFVTGTDAMDARNSLLWDNAEEAEESGDGQQVFNVTARIDWTTMK
jgi:hypothetical protein